MKTMGEPEMSLIKRRVSRQIHLGHVAVGGLAPVSVQTMTKTDTRDVNSTKEQILELERIGCDIIRLAVVDKDAACALSAICRSIHIPVVADIHFDYRLALMSLEAGVDGLRINPGNIGSTRKVKEVASAAQERKVPIRIGVNSGSMEKDILAKHGGPTAEAMVESAMKHVRILEDIGFREIKISVKASDVPRTIQAYRTLAEITDYPLHLGLTEAGTFFRGAVRSSVGLGILLAEGIGDTIRISLTEHPRMEVRAGQEILRALGFRKPGPDVISCPTCGRAQIDVISMAHKVEDEMEKLFHEYPDAVWPCVAIMGCMVNGPGEAAEADIAIAGGKAKSALYVAGKVVATVDEQEIVPALVKQVRMFIAAGKNR